MGSGMSIELMLAALPFRRREKSPSRNGCLQMVRGSTFNVAATGETGDGPTEVAKISFQNRADDLKVELLVIVYGAIAESNHGTHKGAVFLTFCRTCCRGLTRW